MTVAEAWLTFIGARYGYQPDEPYLMRGASVTLLKCCCAYHSGWDFGRRRRPKAKYESGPNGCWMHTATVHIRFEPRIWLAGRCLMSMSAATRSPTAATPPTPISLRLRLLRSLHCCLAATTCLAAMTSSAYLARDPWMARTIHRLASAARRVTGPAVYEQQAALEREGLALPKDAPPARRAALEEAAALYDFLAKRLPEVLDEWRAHRDALRA